MLEFIGRWLSKLKGHTNIKIKSGGLMDKIKDFA